MKVEPRVIALNKAEIKIGETVSEVIEEHDLSTLEIVKILLTIQERHVRFDLKHRRRRTVCPACNGRGSWYSPDTGELVTCSCKGKNNG